MERDGIWTRTFRSSEGVPRVKMGVDLSAHPFAEQDVGICVILGCFQNCASLLWKDLECGVFLDTE